MSRDTKHSLLATPNAEEAERQKFVLSFKRFLNGRVRVNNEGYYDAVTAPLRKAAGKPEPRTRHEASAALYDGPLYRLWSGLNRSAQEHMWLSIGEMVLREEPRMRAQAARLTGDGRNPLGSLRLDPEIGGDSVAAMRGTHVHLQPGGYMLDRDSHDMLAGALYESGGNLYSFGQGMGNRDSKAGCVLRWLDAHADLPDAPRVLDLGCSAGAATCEYAARYPGGEVHAVDIGAGLLRYAHARAEALGVSVHFHQMDTSALSFPDDHFDLVVSHNLLHELSGETRRAMMAEIARVLKPRGTCVLQDVPLRLAGQPLIAQAEKIWDAGNNGELFWEELADADLTGELTAAGLTDAEEHMLPKIDGPGGWYAVIATK